LSRYSEWLCSGRDVGPLFKKGRKDLEKKRKDRAMQAYEGGLKESSEGARA
jgi:hypothetical protein